jgi:hypothetical protein
MSQDQDVEGDVLVAPDRPYGERHLVSIGKLQVFLTIVRRRECEPGLARALTELSVQMIPVDWPPWPKAQGRESRSGIPKAPPKYSWNQLSLCIRRHNVRWPCSDQRAYNWGIMAPLANRAPPNHLSIQALKCLYF